MTNQEKPSLGPLPDYITSAKPNPVDKRAPWYATIAPTYAGIFLWFVFWQDAVRAPNAGGLLSQGLGWALLSIVIAALVCHFLFYLAPGMLGMKTGLPLYIVGTSTFGAKGGFILPGFLMGVLQFGWLGVNVYFSSMALGAFFGLEGGSGAVKLIMVVWGVAAAFIGLKGIQYVAKVATYLPLIPLVILIVLLAKTVGSVGDFSAAKLIDVSKEINPGVGAPLSTLGVLAFALTYIVGFFATAGAAGTDIASSGRDKNDVSMGGLIGIGLATIVTAGISALVVAGVYGSAEMTKQAIEAGMKISADQGGPSAILQSTALTPIILGKSAGLVMFLLAVAAFPSACFSSLIAANSFKTTLSSVNPFVSVGIGAAVSILLALTGWAGKAIIVFQIIGASFGPICGAMLVDYLINGRTWSGPRAGFNPAGWISWALGFIVGILPIVKIYDVPAAPVAAFIVGAVVYFLCAKAGMLSRLISLPAAEAAKK